MAHLRRALVRMLLWYSNIILVIWKDASGLVYLGFSSLDSPISLIVAQKSTTSNLSMMKTQKRRRRYKIPFYITEFVNGDKIIFDDFELYREVEFNFKTFSTLWIQCNSKYNRNLFVVFKVLK